MARLESVAVAGYYPTPAKVVPLIAEHIDVGPHHAFLDPCAGDGAAVLDLARALGLEKPRLYAVEMEKSRHDALEDRIRKDHGYSYGAEILHADAFRVSFRGDGAGLLYLNPPYDTDPETGRLEEKFLARFADALAEDGVLVFVVPHYALSASAQTLALRFTDVRCFRFPEDEFAAYRQVVLFARRRGTDLWEPDSDVVRDVTAWAASVDGMPVVGIVDEKYTVPAIEQYTRAFDEWKIQPLDLRGLLAATAPWSMTDRSGKRAPVAGIVPDGALEDLLVRRYPVAMPPRPAHIAAGIAAGVFNGARIEPDDPSSSLPPLLVKGVFDKEFRKVDEKKDKDGNVKAVIEIQQPKLVTTVLDLSSYEYTTIKATADITGTNEVAKMTMADLLAVYGKGLMRTMLKQCPVLHDPDRDGEDTELALLERPLFRAQTHAATAAVKLLGGPDLRNRRGRAAFILGEIGSGKTSVALSTAQTIQAQRTLVMCPPHLLTSWQNQIKAVCPWVHTVVLNDVADVQDLVASPDRTTIAILSRETAKLGHAYASVSRCGRCGEIPTPDDHAKKRASCPVSRLVLTDSFGRLVRELAVDLLGVFPADVRLRQVVPTGLQKRFIFWTVRADAEGATDRAWSRLLAHGILDRVLDELVSRATSNRIDATSWIDPLVDLLWADPVPAIVLEIARTLYAHGASKGQYDDCVSAARTLLLAVPDADIAEFKALDVERPSYLSDSWKDWERNRAHLKDLCDAEWSFTVKRTKDGKIEQGGKALGDRSVTIAALADLAKRTLKQSRPCGSPLYQAIPEPRRFPLATYIAKRCPRLFDLLILDEGHEYATDGSAQEQAAHRLMGLGIPTMILTGSIMNGYAASLFTNMWAASPDFRREFARDEGGRFVDRYGYKKRLVEDRDKDSGKVVEYGSMSDRVTRNERMIGDAPGVLPVFLLRYLLPLSVTLHKTDLQIDIPRCTETTATVQPTTVQDQQYRQLQTALVAQIKRDRFDPELGGKLWGAMAEIPSYLDLCTDDVCKDGVYEIRYPESAGGRLVASVPALPASIVLPKEQWLLDHVEKAFSAGRNVLIFGWHVRLLARIARLVREATGEQCPILIPEKVPTKKREDWITSEVVNRGRRALVCNPLTVQTGLNNLVYFADEVWLENPACNPVVYRQAVGRVDRIGQKKTTEILFPLYAGTAQQQLHSLLLQKVGISMSADGLDGESAMQAAGIGEDGFSSFSVGRQLYELLTEDRTAKKRAA